METHCCLHVWCVWEQCRTDMHTFPVYVCSVCSYVFPRVVIDTARWRHYYWCSGKPHTILCGEQRRFVFCTRGCQGCAMGVVGLCSVLAGGDSKSMQILLSLMCWLAEAVSD